MDCLKPWPRRASRFLSSPPLPTERLVRSELPRTYDKAFSQSDQSRRSRSGCSNGGGSSRTRSACQRRDHSRAEVTPGPAAVSLPPVPSANSSRSSPKRSSGLRQTPDRQLRISEIERNSVCVSSTCSGLASRSKRYRSSAPELRHLCQSTQKLSAMLRRLLSVSSCFLSLNALRLRPPSAPSKAVTPIAAAVAAALSASNANAVC